MEEKGEENAADDKSRNKTFKWKVKGRVVARGISQSGIEACTHPTLMKDMCAECGADLRENPGHAGARKEAVSASVAMVHSIPELIVSEEEALRIGRADEHRLLRTRKLVLLVDLDQTLIHTTNDNIPANLKGVYHFQLSHGSRVLWYHTRLRPHTEEFLKKISEMYELHICTFGVRLYAHTITNFLDPEGKYFSHRILSRDECFSFNSKIPNLKALFPCGDSMVAIIDDREDVWSYSPNLIHVKPYRFFQGTADINAPPGCTKTESDADPVSHKVRRISHTSDGNSQVEEIDPKTESEIVKASKTENEVIKDNSETKDEEEQDSLETGVEIKSNKAVTDKDVEKDSEMGEILQKEVCKNSDNQSEDITEENGDMRSKENETVSSKTETVDCDSVCNTEVETVMDSESKSLTGEEGKDSKNDSVETDTEGSQEKGKNVETVTEEIEWVDEDDYLFHLEEILTRVHTAFYDVYDQMTKKGNADKIPDMKSVLPYVKKKVLKSVNIVFSGVFPTNMPPEKSRAYLVARSLGANIQTNFVSASLLGEGDTSDHTTHVIAARLGTVKVRSAQKSRTAFLVTPDWLWCCNDRWERVDERLFALTKDNQSILPAKRCSPDVLSQELQQSESMKRKNETPAEEVFVYDRVTGKRVQPNKRRKSPEDEAEACSSNPFTMADEEIPSEFNKTGTSGEKTADGREQFSKSYNPLFAFSTEDIASMDREVEELMDDDEDDNNDAGLRGGVACDDMEDAGMDPKEERELRRKVLGKHVAHESSSEEDSMTGDFPRGWQLKKKLSLMGKLKASPERVFIEGLRHDESSIDAADNENIEIDSDDDANEKRQENESDVSDNDSIGSVDDIIAEAVQKEFLS